MPAALSRGSPASRQPIFRGSCRTYRSGARANAIMSPIARALSPDDAADVSAYFASLDAPFPPLAAPDPNLVEKGKGTRRGG